MAQAGIRPPGHKPRAHPRGSFQGRSAGDGAGLLRWFHRPGHRQLPAVPVRAFLPLRLPARQCLRQGRVVNCGTNAATLVFLVPAGLVNYKLAVPLGVAAILGAIVGSQLAMRGGNKWIRCLFLTLAIILLAKLGWESLRPALGL
ncbi:TSUP family transporter [Candidatus Dactylopiibacterium carminicum]|uniref:TSUP family transporter n=1 Tax=Candidatus Dactylopiibacterium carminicum TaxID=857335 RepID=UPI003B96919E